ncbi:MAG TPA: ATP-binding protein [Anaerolineae bacterium]|nr:ATP-binding protein [Anaerolineae bacterium]HQI87039.1 ATP-binding protein [Anaerolineae bacterium]
MNERPIGLTKGPGETPHEFLFVSPDREQALKVGEFVVYRAPVDGQERNILARVTQRQPLRLYPDAFLADPGVGPEQVATLLGYEQASPDLFELVATVIGYYDAALGDFINPRVPPRSGCPITLASDKLLAAVLSKRRADDTGAGHIGSLLSRPSGQVPVMLDLAAIASTHLAILASTGAGKSYLAAVLIEELLKPNNRAAILVVDPHGEYNTLIEMLNHPAFIAPEYRPDVQILKPDAVKVRVGTLTLGDLFYLLPNLSEKMSYLLRQVYREVCQRSQITRHDPERWTRGELIGALQKIAEDDDNKQDAGTAGALIWRLESVLEHQSAIFDDFHHLDLNRLFRPGRCSVLQLNEVDEREQQVTVATLLRRLFAARMKTQKGLVKEGDELYLPYPVFVLMEEAHRFAPAGGEAVSAGVLKTVLSEGRKFGVAVGLISQRPGKLDADVLSQCGTQCILRIVNPLDQNRVAESVETVGRDLLRELPALTKGQDIIAGEAVNTPVLCQVRQRYTPHGAESRNAPEEWLAYFAPEEQARRERESAPLAVPKRSGESKMFK